MTKTTINVGDKVQTANHSILASGRVGIIIAAIEDYFVVTLEDGETINAEPYFLELVATETPTKEMTKTTKLTTAQEVMLNRIAAQGASRSRMGKTFYYTGTSEVAHKVTLNALTERRLLESKRENASVFYMLTDLGRAAIGNEATETPAAPVEEIQPEPCEVCGEEINFCTCEQPAQPLAELETLRAENAALKRENEWRKSTIDFVTTQAENAAEQVDALQSGMKEKDAAFNTLLVERNALKAALVQIRNTSDGDSELLKIAKQWSTVEQVERSLSNTVKFINSTLESE